MDKTLTIYEASILLGMSPDVLRVYIHRGKIKANKRGSMWFIKKKDVIKYKKNIHT